jgi:hypothetical protein
LKVWKKLVLRAFLARDRIEFVHEQHVERCDNASGNRECDRIARR